MLSLEYLLEVKDLKTHFYTKKGVIKAVNGISYGLKRGQTLSIVGESGSGKSVSVLSIMRLLPTYAKVNGKILFEGNNLLSYDDRKIKRIRGNRISMIFQDPMSSLNPTVKIGQQIMEPLLWHHKASKREARQKAIQMLTEVGIPSAKERFDQYPFEFSGGMRQRVMIAMALISEPELLIADEPTTSLDVTVQAQILQLIRKIQEKRGTSVILITHNLAVATMVSDYIVVMYGGRIVEKATTEEFLKNPLHPYTFGLLNSTPVLKSRKTLSPIPGQPPDLRELEDIGCPFAKRCPKKMPRCEKENPPEINLSNTHTVYCWLYT